MGKTTLSPSAPDEAWYLQYSIQVPHGFIFIQNIILKYRRNLFENRGYCLATCQVYLLADMGMMDEARQVAEGAAVHAEEEN